MKKRILLICLFFLISISFVSAGILDWIGGRAAYEPVYWFYDIDLSPKLEVWNISIHPDLNVWTNKEPSSYSVGESGTLWVKAVETDGSPLLPEEGGSVLFSFVSDAIQGTCQGPDCGWKLLIPYTGMGYNKDVGYYVATIEIPKDISKEALKSLRILVDVSNGKDMIRFVGGFNPLMEVISPPIEEKCNYDGLCDSGEDCNCKDCSLDSNCVNINVKEGIQVTSVWSDKETINYGDWITIYSKVEKNDGSILIPEEGTKVLLYFNTTGTLVGKWPMNYDKSTGYYSYYVDVYQKTNFVPVVVIASKGGIESSYTSFGFKIKGADEFVIIGYAEVIITGKNYILIQGSPIIIEGKKIILNKVSPDGAFAINVGGVIEVINLGATETINGIEITNIKAYTKKEERPIIPSYIEESVISPEIEETITTPEGEEAEMPFIPTSEKGCASGCLMDNGVCVPFGTRAEGNYCDISKQFLAQKEIDKSCENNYECKSNECSNGKCISTYSLLEKILEFLKGLFK